MEALKFMMKWGDEMQSIAAQDLQPFPELIHIALGGNNLTSLDGDLFSFNPRLERIILNLNRIQHIGHDLVTNLNNLTYLSLAANICVNRNAGTRSQVLELAIQLPALCPPLFAPETTTEQAIEQCPCDEQIEELRVENQQLREENQWQNKRIDDIESRLREFEERFREV